LARVNEARARAVANRAKLRANSARLINQARSSTSVRSKRQYPPAPPEQPHFNDYDENGEPLFVHICPIDDDDGYVRSAESQQQHPEEDFRVFGPQNGNQHVPAGEDEQSFVERPRLSPDSSAREAGNQNVAINPRRKIFVKSMALRGLPVQNPEAEESLDQAIEELKEVRELVDRFEERNLRRSEIRDGHRPNSRFPSSSFLLRKDPVFDPNSHSNQEEEDEETSTNVGGLQEVKEAEAHLFPPRLHSHQLSVTHGVSTFPQTHGLSTFPQTQGLVPGLHVPQTHLVSPGLNLNINQNQALNPGISHLPVVNQGVVPSIHTTPIHGGLVVPQSQSIIHQKNAEAGTQLHSHNSFPNHLEAQFDVNRGQRPPGLFQLTASDGSKLGQGSQHFPQTRPISPFAQTSRIIVPSSGQNFQTINHNRGGVGRIVPPQRLGGGFGRVKEAQGEENFSVDQGEEDSTSDVFNQQEQMDFLSRHKFREILPLHNTEYIKQFREASPTHKLKKKLKQQYYQSYPSYGKTPHQYSPNTGHYREAEEVDAEDPMLLLDSREASPTHKLKKKLQQQHYQSYPSSGNHYSQSSQNAGHYREAEEVGSVANGLEEVDAVASSFEEVGAEDPMSLFDSREASPTHKLKKKLKQQHYQSYPSYGQNPHQYGQNTGHYREAEERDSEDNLEDPMSSFDSREASPTHKLKKKLKQQNYQSYPSYSPNPSHYSGSYTGRYREAEGVVPEDNVERHGDDSFVENRLTAPYLLNFPINRYPNQYKRSIDKLDTILGMERQIVDSLKDKSKNDEDLKLVADISNRTLIDLEDQRKKITKRSIPLTRLISDPTVKLDVPKTIENFGTATKHAFEDERAPLYHLKHLMGSSRNALLSAMKIPPQNMIIPTDYEIVKSSDRVGAANPSLRTRSGQDEDDARFSRTFKRVGEMVRESIKSGQETASHIGEIAHDARNILNSARHSAPRLIIPYSQIPAVQRRPPSKAILITPRIVDLVNERTAKKPADTGSNFVRMGHIMDAIGFSKPNSKSLDLQKIIFEPRRVSQARVDERLAELYSRFRDTDNDDVDTVGEALSTLEDAKISVGAKNLRDFLVKMKNELTSMVRSSPDEHKRKKAKSKKKKKKQETKEMGRFIETLFDGSTNETVGSGLFLSPELLHPFMGRASENELRDFLRDNGDDVKDLQKQNQAPKDHYGGANHGDHDNPDLGYVLGAINPLMLERMYNQTVKVKGDATDPDVIFQKPSEVEGNGTVGTSMAVSGAMLKPFMGMQPQAVEKFLDTYNREPNEDYVETED
jgi:hypothetical protein